MSNQGSHTPQQFSGGEVRDTTEGLVNKWGDQIEQGIDAAGQAVDRATGGKYSGAIDKGEAMAKDALDGLDGKNDDIGAPPSEPGRTDPAPADPAPGGPPQPSDPTAPAPKDPQEPIPGPGPAPGPQDPDTAPAPQEPSPVPEPPGPQFPEQDQPGSGEQPPQAPQAPQPGDPEGGPLEAPPRQDPRE